MTSGTIISCYCPGMLHNKVLARIVEGGTVIILRPHHMEAYFMAPEFYVECKNCGYNRFVQVDNFSYPAQLS